jgi:hypothetical protein
VWARQVRSHRRMMGIVIGRYGIGNSRDMHTVMANNDDVLRLCTKGRTVTVSEALSHPLSEESWTMEGVSKGGGGLPQKGYLQLAHPRQKPGMPPNRVQIAISASMCLQPVVRGHRRYEHSVRVRMVSSSRPCSQSKSHGMEGGRGCCGLLVPAA